MKSIVIEAARNGEPSASTGSIRIYSAYNPSREALRFIESRLPDIPPRSTIVIIGAGLGYIDQELQRQRPKSTIVALHLDSALYRGCYRKFGENDHVIRWHPTQGNLGGFLQRVLTESRMPSLRIIEWPPITAARSQAADEAFRLLAEVVRRQSGNISATAAFGRLWIRNTFRNFIESDTWVTLKRSTGPVVLAAAGPSLEKALDVMNRYRQRYRLWALPSALAALQGAGICPDLIFATDPGIWARLHSRFISQNVPIAMPLSGLSPPDWAGPPLWILQDSPGEGYLMKQGGMLPLELPSRGTVAATAMEAWSGYCSGPLILVGLDLAWYDLRAHARPHSFDGWLTEGSSRLKTDTTVAWERAMLQAPRRQGSWRIGSPLETYTDWFCREAPRGLIYRYRHPGIPRFAASLPGITEGSEELFSNLPSAIGLNPITEPIESNLKHINRIRIVKELLKKWYKMISESDDLDSREAIDIRYALDPGGMLDMKHHTGTDLDKRRQKHRERVMQILESLEPRCG